MGIRRYRISVRVFNSIAHELAQQAQHDGSGKKYNNCVYFNLSSHIW